MAYLPEVNISDYTDAAKAQREMRQKNLLQRALQSNLNENGQVNQQGFYRDAARYGLDPESIHTGMKLNAMQQDEAVSSLDRQLQAKSLYGDLRAGERNQAPYGAPVEPEKPALTEIPNPAYAEWEARNPQPVQESQSSQLPKSEKVRNYFMSMGFGRKQQAPQTQAPVMTHTPPDSAFSPVPTETPAAPPVSTPEPTTTPAPAPAEPDDTSNADGMDLGASNITGSLPTTTPGFDLSSIGYGDVAPSKTIPYQPPTPPTPKDTRSFEQRVADTFNPPSGLFDTMGGGAGAASAAGKDDDPLLVWNPENDGTNEYVQYKTALDSALKSNGFNDASSFLKHVKDSTMLANMPREPNRGLLQLGKEGRSKYMGELADYKAGIAKAEGLAKQAVIEERRKLADFAKQFGTNVVDTRKTELDDKYILRDPAKRTEAQALITNRETIKYVQEAVKSAGNNTAKLKLVFPQLARAYATAANPGMQLNQGNLQEVAEGMFPESIGNKEFIARVTSGIARGLVNKDWSMFQQFGDALEAQAPGALAERMNKLAAETQQMNETTLRGYVTVREEKTADESKPASETPKPSQSGVAGVVESPEELMDIRAQLAQRLGLPGMEPEAKKLGYSTMRQMEAPSLNARLADTLGIKPKPKPAAPSKKPNTKPTGSDKSDAGKKTDNANKKTPFISPVTGKPIERRSW